MPNFSYINIGNYANDNSGDSLRVAFQKINLNFGNLNASNIIPISEQLAGTKNGNNQVFTSTYTVLIDYPYLLFYNGQLLQATVDYSVSGNTWTYLTFAPVESSSNQVVYSYAGEYIINAGNPFTQQLSGVKNGTNRVFTSSFPVLTDYPYLLFYNGQLLQATVDYSVSGNTWTYLTFAPAANSINQVLYNY